METFTFNEHLYTHVRGKTCKECWRGYPRTCECGGLIHAEFGDEGFDGYYLVYHCEKCGDDYEFAEER